MHHSPSKATLSRSVTHVLRHWNKYEPHRAQYYGCFALFTFICMLCFACLFVCSWQIMSRRQAAVAPCLSLLSFHPHASWVGLGGVTCSALALYPSHVVPREGAKELTSSGRSYKPSIVTLLHHIHDVPFLKLQLVIVTRGIVVKSLKPIRGVHNFWISFFYGTAKKEFHCAGKHVLLLYIWQNTSVYMNWQYSTVYM